MRTTVTLDPDLAEEIRREMARTGRGFKAILNECVRRGLAQRVVPATRPFCVHARDLGLRPGFALDDVEGLLDQLEGPYRR